MKGFLKFFSVLLLFLFFISFISCAPPAQPKTPEETSAETSEEIAGISTTEEQKTQETGNEYPSPVGYVNDFANIFEPEYKDKMDKLIKDLEEKTSAEIAVVTVDSLGDKSIEEYAFGLFNTWGIGKKDKNNGVLFLVAPQERKVRIEVGFGLEDVITNEIAQKIIDEIVIPRFKEREYGLGSYECVKEMSEIIMSANN